MVFQKIPGSISGSTWTPIAGRVDENAGSSPLKVFDTQVEGRSQYARAVTSFGPRIRWRPFKGDYRFTIQSSISFPTGIPYEKEQVLGPDRIYFLAGIV